MVKILKAVPKDSDFLTKIAFESKAYWGYPQKWLIYWRDQIAVSDHHFESDIIYKALDEHNDLVGFYKLTGKGEKLINDGFWVLPKFMGKGVGRQLFNHMIQTAQNLECDYIEWESDPNAVSFYLKMGAVIIGGKEYELFGEKRVLPIMRYTLKET